MRTSSGTPAVIYSLDGCPDLSTFCTIPLEDRGPLPGLDSSFATVPDGSNGVGLTPEDFRLTQGVENRVSSLQNLRSAEETYGVTLNGRFELSPNLELFSDFSYTHRKVPAYQLSFGLAGGQYNVPSAVIPASHPFNPFGVPLGVSYNTNATEIYTSFGQEHYRGLLGMKGKLGRFDWEVSRSQARDKSRTYGASSWNSDAIIAALASTDPELTINPFISDGGPPASQEVLRSLLGADLDNSTESKTDVISGFVRGSLFKMPAGNLTALAGVESGKQSVWVKSNYAFTSIPYLEGDSKSRAVFAEMRLPVLSPRTGSSYERVAFTGAWRSESSDRYTDSTQTNTIALELRPTESLLLRSTYSTAFRPLLVYSAVQAPLEFPLWIEDPEFNGMAYQVNTTYWGGVPLEIKPETSATTTFGALYRPTPDLSLSLTHWEIEFRDRISSVSLQTLVDNEDLYPARIRRDPATGLIEYIDARQVNISRQDVAGVDIEVEGHWPTSIGDFYSVLSATYTYKYEQQLTDDSPVVSGVAIHNLYGWAPRWKVVPRIGWDYQDWMRTSVVGRFVSKYKDSEALSTGAQTGKVQDLGDFWLFDMNLDLSLSKFFEGSLFSGSTLGIGATNVLNRMPDYCAGCYSSGYDAGQYDIMGRQVYAELRFRF